MPDYTVEPTPYDDDLFNQETVVITNADHEPVAYCHSATAPVVVAALRHLGTAHGDLTCPDVEGLLLEAQQVLARLSDENHALRRDLDLARYEKHLAVTEAVDARTPA